MFSHVCRFAILLCPLPSVDVFMLSNICQSDLLNFTNRQSIETNGNNNRYMDYIESGQIMIFHQPRFPWNKGISLAKPPFGVGSCEVAIIWPDRMDYIVLHSHQLAVSFPANGLFKGQVPNRVHQRIPQQKGVEHTKKHNRAHHWFSLGGGGAYYSALTCCLLFKMHDFQ